MARKTTVMVIDDLDGRSNADETVGFVLDGKEYEVDLCSINAQQLRADFQKWIDASRRVGGRRQRSPIEGDAPHSRVVRRWAVENGYSVPIKGRLPDKIFEAYRAAN